MAELSPKIKLKDGVYYRMINPEGSANHRAPKIKMWKEIKKPDPFDKNKTMSFFRIIDAPHSPSINDGRTINLYSKKGLKPLHDCFADGQYYNGIPLPSNWQEVNRKYVLAVAKAGEKVNHQGEAIDKLTELVKLMILRGVKEEGSEKIDFDPATKSKLELLTKEVVEREQELEKELEKEDGNDTNEQDTKETISWKRKHEDNPEDGEEPGGVFSDKATGLGKPEEAIDG